MSKRCIPVLLLCLVAGPAMSAGIVNPQVNGNRLTATISLAGQYQADLTIEFENAVGLTPQNLGLSADLVNVSNPSLVGRLPDSSVSLLAGFPVRLTIDPPPAGGFSFSGIASIELYTHNLNFDPAVPLRFFSAETGDDFHDITERVSSGSYRTGGSKGQFSEFLIVLDGRGNSAAAVAKFGRLNDLLTDYQSVMPATLAADLQGYIDAAESAEQAGDYAGAISSIEDFSAAVTQAADNGDIPSVWRSARDLDNVAGELRAAADTLRFSLTQLANGL